MLGERLKSANGIAQKRADRHDYYGWPKHNGVFRKWNGSCSCGMCRGERYKDKGFNKRRYFQTR